MLFAAIVAACLLGSTVAFAPRANVPSSSALMAAKSKSIPFLLNPVNLDGSLAGDEGFDPLGLSNINELGLDLYWMREAELKHGRIAMLAVVGSLAQEIGIVFPGYPTEKNQIDAFWAVADRYPGQIASAFLFLGIVELISGVAVTEGKKVGRAPGEFGFNPLGFGKTDATKKDLALKEVRNGRLAMWAAAGILLQGATTNAGALENLF